MSKILPLVWMTLLTVALPAEAVTLERIVSREDPKFNCTAAVMTVGRDGNVYLSSVVNGGGSILRVSRDGTRKLGGDAIYSMANATANAEGVIASANSHFNHSVNLYDATFKHFAACGEFLVNDTVQWDAPARVEAGASGDFCGSVRPARSCRSMPSRWKQRPLTSACARRRRRSISAAATACCGASVSMAR